MEMGQGGTLLLVDGIRMRWSRRVVLIVSA